MSCPPDELVESLRAALEAEYWDDGIEVISATPTWIRLWARCDPGTAARLVHFIEEIAAELPEDERHAVAMAAREMLLNAMEHGGEFDPHNYVEFGYLRTGRAVSCRIRDPGKGFSPEEIPHSALSNPVDDPFRHLTHRDARGLRPGGYGLLLAKQLVDELLYNEQGNEVVLVKYLDKRAPAQT
jgi:anti-sigma regulatory factor (Ser/Thr protein kinase)